MDSTRYQKSVRNVQVGTHKVLKPGSSNKKLGRKVLRGPWKGAYIYSLTLVERETCPRSCHHWDDCYGNNMPFAHRFRQHGTALQVAIEKEVSELCKKHDKVAIRLHVLGDFYSVDYVRFWDALMCVHPNLHVWGYTARIPQRDKIGREVVALNLRYPNRWAVRISSSQESTGPNAIYAAEEGFTGDHFVCPEQTKKVKSCGDCGLCWQSPKTVKFLSH